MTEHQVTELLERATAELRPDPRLVGSATATGRRRRRRHLVGTAAAAVAVLGLAATGLTLGLSGDGPDARRGVDVAGTSKPAKPQPAAVEPWRLAVTAEQVPATFGSLVPGTVTTVPNKEMDDANPIIDFRWDGYAVRVGLVSDSYVTGERVPDPLQRCQEQGSSGQACSPGQVAGSYEQTMTWTGPPADGGITVRMLTVYFAQGWDVTVTEANAADTKDSPVLSPDVPLTLAQLRTVAYSDAWFH